MQLPGSVSAGRASSPKKPCFGDLRVRLKESAGACCHCPQVKQIRRGHARLPRGSDTCREDVAHFRLRLHPPLPALPVIAAFSSVSPAIDGTARQIPSFKIGVAHQQNPLPSVILDDDPNAENVGVPEQNRALHDALLVQDRRQDMDNSFNMSRRLQVLSPKVKLQLTHAIAAGQIRWNSAPTARPRMPIYRAQ